MFSTNNHSCNLPVTYHIVPFSQFTKNSNQIPSAGLASSAQTEGILVSDSLNSSVMSSPAIPARKLLHDLQVPQGFSSILPAPPLWTCISTKRIKQQRKKELTPIESCKCLDVYFFFYIYFLALRMLLSFCYCH